MLIFSALVLKITTCLGRAFYAIGCLGGILQLIQVIHYGSMYIQQAFCNKKQFFMIS